MVAKVSSVLEEYLEAIYRLEDKSGVAKTSELVKLLNVAPGTVTNTIERLEKESFVIHESYRGVRLTKEGRRVAMRTIRKHRLSERLLTDILKVDWDRAHDAACELEHSISDEIANKIGKVLGHPKACPHGNPIPTESGAMIKEGSESLAKFKLQERGILVKITDERSDLLHYLNKLNLRPNVNLEIVEKAPFDGPITVRVGGKDLALSRDIAAVIRARRLGR